MIKSEFYKGLIYAGDTPLASTIVVEQTGSMELTIRAGSFTTTGQARIVSPNENTADILATKIAANEAELLADGRVRVWLSNPEGVFLKPEIITLASDEIVAIQPDLIMNKFCSIELGLLEEVPEILVRYRLDNGLEYPDYPTGWITIHPLVLEFMISPGQTELGDIYVLTVLPGFPPGTGPNDWLIQGGGL